MTTANTLELDRRDFQQRPGGTVSRKTENGNQKDNSENHVYQENNR